MIRKFTRALQQKQGTILRLLLSLVVVLFLGILLTAYLVARRANPIFLDAQGKPLNAPTTAARPY